MDSVYIIRDAAFGRDFTPKLVMGIVALALALWDARRERRTDYLWVAAFGTAVWGCAEWLLANQEASGQDVPQFDVPAADQPIQGLLDRRAREKGKATPTRNEKEGWIKSCREQPAHSTCD